MYGWPLLVIIVWMHVSGSGSGSGSGSPPPRGAFGLVPAARFATRFVAFDRTNRGVGGYSAPLVVFNFAFTFSGWYGVSSLFSVHARRGGGDHVHALHASWRLHASQHADAESESAATADDVDVDDDFAAVAVGSRTSPPQ